jgi:5-methylcytosine-specific restriction protein B
MNTLDPRVERSLRDAFDALQKRGELLPTERLQASYAGFRSRFGPDALNSLDGVALLNAMHAHGNKESLVYWLEFKNDDEFPGPSLAASQVGARISSVCFDVKKRTSGS